MRRRGARAAGNGAHCTVWPCAAAGVSGQGFDRSDPRAWGGSLLRLDESGERLGVRSLPNVVGALWFGGRRAGSWSPPPAHPRSWYW